MKHHSRLKEVFYPSIFHRSASSSGFFEGWYFKAESRDCKRAFAFIFGVSVNDLNPHSFIQIFDGELKTAEYFSFPLSEFKSETSEFSISIGKNYLSLKRCILDISESGRIFKADISVKNISPIRRNIFQPGAMGPFGYIPFMECNHHILSMKHTLSGHIETDGSEISIDGGTGYIEKDWGRSFPSSYIWLQSNRFSDPTASFMFSLAKVPFISFRFPGMISVLKYRGKELRFATYNLSKAEIITLNESEFHANLKGVSHSMEVYAKKGDGALLKSPQLGKMSSKIGESLKGVISVRIKDRFSNVLFEDEGMNSGVEIEAASKDDFSIISMNHKSKEKNCN